MDKEMKIKEKFEVENCEECPCYHPQYNRWGREIPGCCGWADVDEVPPGDGIPEGCWLREGALVVQMKGVSDD